MIALLAPAKKMDFDTDFDTTGQEKPPVMMDKTSLLAELMRSKDVQSIQELMKVSPAIADETHKRFTEFSFGSDTSRVRPAILAYKGDTYQGLDSDTLSVDDLTYSENRLRILSGLYGLLSPLTLIEPYRLEMGLKLDIGDYKKISAFWKETVTEEINSILNSHNDKLIIDLASAEYMAAVDKKRIDGTIIDIVFRENRDGVLKTIAALSKKARGMMARYMVQDRIETAEGLKAFKSGGYRYDAKLSDETSFVFVR